MRSSRSDPAFRWLRLLLALVRMLLLLSTLAVAAATALPALHTDQWLVRTLGYPALQFLLLGLLLAASLLIVPDRSRLGARWVTGLAVAVLLVSCLWNALRLAPYLRPLVAAGPIPTVASGSCPADRRLRVFEANVQMTNQHDHRLLNMVHQAAPDIAWFQETDSWWEHELSPLSAIMPNGAAKALPNYFGVHLFSKLPLEDVHVQNLTNSRNPSVTATATLPSGRKVRIHAIHPRPPQVGQSTAERDAQLLASALEARTDTLAHIIVGDLNTVPWESALHRTEDIGGVQDPRIGRGLFITWNAKRFLAKWPLDHILTGTGVTLSELRVLPPFGSDHQPLMADLCVEAPGPSPAALDPNVLAGVRETIERGQGRATQQGASAPTGTDSSPDDVAK